MTHTIAGTPAAGPNNGKTLRILQLYPKDMNIYGGKHPSPGTPRTRPRVRR